VGQQPYGGPVQQTAPAALGGRPQAVFTADGVRLSGWWWRVLAAWLDSIFISVLVAIPAFPIYRRMYGSIAAYLNEVFSAAQSGQAPPAQPAVTSFLSSTDQAALLAIQIGVALVYNIAFLRWRSATLGMLICGLRVVPVDRGRFTDRLEWGSIVIRWTSTMTATCGGNSPVCGPTRSGCRERASRSNKLARHNPGS